MLVTPASSRQGVADNVAAVETRVEVQCDVVGVVADVDGKAVSELGGRNKEVSETAGSG